MNKGSNAMLVTSPVTRQNQRKNQKMTGYCRLNEYQLNLIFDRTFSPMSDHKMIPSCGINSFNLEFIVGPPSKQSLFSSIGQTPLRVSSSTTKEIVTLPWGEV